MLLNFMRPTGNSTYQIYGQLGMKLLARLQLGFRNILRWLGSICRNTNLDITWLTH